jgi:hypothetical protein
MRREYAMNHVDPISTSTDASESSCPNGQPRRRSTTGFTAAPSLALAVLAAAPLAAVVRIVSHFGDPQTAAVLANDCSNAFSSGALHVLKWPDCAGD